MANDQMSGSGRSTTGPARVRQGTGSVPLVGRSKVNSSSSHQQYSSSSRSSRPSSSSRSTSSRSSKPRSTNRSGGRTLSGMSRSNTGYTLRRHSINFNDRRMGGGPESNRRLIILGVCALVILILLIFGISSCVSSCSSKQAEEQAAATAANQTDSRVASGVSDDMTSRLSTALDRDDKLSHIAANADQYPSERMLALALDEPAAIDFVNGWLTSDKTATAYTDTVTKGTLPSLLMFDTRWGNVDYGGLPLGVVGSGPTCLSMAYMSLTGQADKSPADVATLLVNGGFATGETGGGTNGAGFSSIAGSLGLSVKDLGYDADSIMNTIEGGGVVICEMKADTLTAYDHFVVLNTNDDNTLAVLDPTSTEVSSHAWSYATITSSASAAWAVSASTSE